MNNHFNKRGRNNHQRRRQGVNPNRALDSNGPDVRIRGTAQQIYDKYVALARDATSSGDRVKTENYLQHAEHYFRVLRSVQGPQNQPTDQSAENEADGDQPSIGDQRQPEHQGDGASPDAPAARDNAEPAPTEAGADQSQGGRAAGGADPESRRRRRRPRRPREDGEPAAAEDTPAEPVAAD
jgi:hypothetical protein